MINEEIQERIAKSKERLTKRRARQEQENKNIKEGVAYIHENKLPVMVRELKDGSKVIITVEWNKKAYSWKSAFALCSKRDSYSTRIGKGLVGYRLKNSHSKFINVLVMPEDINLKFALEAAYIKLIYDATTNKPHIPQNLRRLVQNNIKNFRHSGSEVHALTDYLNIKTKQEK